MGMKCSRAVFIEQVKVAVRSILGQALRTTLTVSIIGIGIMALIAMVTAIESSRKCKVGIFVFSTNTFSIRPLRTGGYQRGEELRL